MLIDCFLLYTAFTTGELVKVKPTKIVAGHEAERTNEFLQILSITILKEVLCTIMYFVSGVSPHISLISNLLYHTTSLNLAMSPQIEYPICSLVCVQQVF